MRLFNSVVLAALLVLGASTPAGWARRIENWPYDRLFKEADLVVIARAKSSEDCDDTTTDNIWKAEFLGTNTTFTVAKVLKGKCDADKITVLHFRLKEGTAIVSGPLLVTFRTKGTEIELNGGKKVGIGAPDYMLFLKATKDGRFEPVSGRTDPELSVKEVSVPFLTALAGDEKKK
jgi:hypothetical protein